LLGRLGADALRRRRIIDDMRLEETRTESDSTWYHEGPDSLRVAREWIAEFSIPRAKERIRRLREEAELPEKTRMAQQQEVQKKVKTLDVEASQIVDQRPVSYCQFSPDNSMLATASWSGVCKLWSVPECKELRTLRGHSTHAGAIVWNPTAKIDLESGETCLASCASDGSVHLWSLDSEEPVADIEGHDARVSRCAYHPSGRFLATAVWDNSWRLWDLEQLTEVLHQEGHSKEVHCVAFQPDGALCVSGGLDSFGRVWDLRTGQCIMFLEGHLKGVTGADWSPDGHRLVTASQDNSCKVWDLRKRNIEYTIPAHTNLVSNVKFERAQHGEFLLSSSYDGTARLWAAKTWLPLATLQGHDNKVSGCDISPDGKTIATCSFDRTFKLWRNS
jgi:U4/U6 small nuclear ribonucleoprotein PRP4